MNLAWLGYALDGVPASERDDGHPGCPGLEAALFAKELRLECG
jgi:hypothetical protein